MKKPSHEKHHQKKQNSSKYLLWPLFVLLFLTIGVFFTAREVPNKQEIRSHAQDFSPTATNTPIPTPTPAKGVDATINLAYSLPGNASAGANLNPLHKTRPVTLHIYDIDTNAEDLATQPLFSIETTAVYEADPQSANYTRFIARDINLQEVCSRTHICVPAGKYQFVLKANQSLRKVIKQNETDFSGKVYDLSDRRIYNLNFGTLIMGDIVPAPQGDNLVDAEDINSFIHCLGDKFNSASCVDKQGPDFDDNGVVDETDHNILNQSIQTILALGGTIAPPTPTKKPEKKTTPTPKPTMAHQSNQNSAVLNLLFLGAIFVVMVIITIFLFTNKKLRNSFSKTNIEKKEYFIKKQSDDDEGKGIWLTLTDDNSQQLGHYAGYEVNEGFGHIQGEMKNVNGKKYIEVTDILWEEQT